MSAKKEYLIWIDLEMTGLDVATDEIIEIATVVTDGQLEVIAEGPVLAIHQSGTTLAGMDAWNTRQHGKSGLTERVRDSKLTAAAAEKATLDFLKPLIPAGGSPMCGNSICQDRRFLARLMPTLGQYFHYRNLDVSTIKELATRWRPELPQYQKNNTHLALEDIYDSIAELAYYRKRFFQLSTE